MSAGQQDEEVYYNYIFGVVRNLIEYQEYQEKKEIALKSITKKFALVTDQENINAYFKSVELVRNKEKKFRKYSNENRLDLLIEDEIKNFRNLDIPTATLKLMLHFIFYQRYER